MSGQCWVASSFMNLKNNYAAEHREIFSHVYICCRTPCFSRVVLFSQPGISSSIVKEFLQLAFPTDGHHLPIPARAPHT